MILGSGLIQSSGWTPEWIIRDEFTDTVAAGSVDGTAATPGPGTRAATDTESKVSVGSGVLAFAGGKTSPSSGDPGIWYGAQSRAAGLAVVNSVTTASISALSRYVMWDSNTSGAGVHDIQQNDATELRIGAQSSNVVVGAIALSTDYDLAIILRTTGAFYYIRGGAFAEWTCIWIDAAEATATLYPGATTYNGGYNVDCIRVTQLPAPFDTDTGLVTDLHAGSVSAGTTFTHEADALIEFTVTTLATSGYPGVTFRSVDANNLWLIEIEGGSGNLRLYERVSGAYSQRGFAASAVSDGTRIVVIADNQSISLYADNTKLFTYANAANFATATAGLTLDFGTGGAVSDLITWPRQLSGTAAAILDKASA